jgi:hypothetical protein
VTHDAAEECIALGACDRFAVAKMAGDAGIGIDGRERRSVAGIEAAQEEPLGADLVHEWSITRRRGLSLVRGVWGQPCCERVTVLARSPFGV